MGYDCTLHLVDEHAIREDFVPRLLGLSSKETAVERVMKDPAGWWAGAAKGLETGRPRDRTVNLCNSAVEFSACSLPYHYERGLALSLWERQSDELALAFPKRYLFSPQALFGAVLDRHPELRGHFPTEFEANFMTGVYVPSERVPKVLEWAEGQVARFDKGDQRRFKGLLRVMRSAAERRLAYWEATDLTVPFCNKGGGDPKLMTADFLDNEPTAASRDAEFVPIDPAIDTLNSGVVDHFLVSSCDRTFQTRIWDLSSWPPTPRCTVPGFASSWARSHRGGWLLLMETDADAESRTFVPHVYRDLGSPAASSFPVQETEGDGRLSAAFLGSKPLVFRESSSTLPGQVVEPPLVLIDGRWRLLAGLGSAVTRAGTGQFAQQPVAGVARLADGRSVVIWDEDGYEAVGNRFERTFVLGARESHAAWTSAPAGPDGFFYLSGRCLYEARRGYVPIAHGPKWTNIMHVRGGPRGSLLLREGKNKDGDVAKLYFPSDATFIHMEPELFDDGEYSAIGWSEEADRFIAIAKNRFVSIPTATVLALPRYSVSTGRRVRD